MPPRWRWHRNSRTNTKRHDALIAAKTKLTEAAVDDLLAKAGVDVGRATADRTAHQQEIDALLARNDAQARAFGFRGTPGFIIGTFRVPGSLNGTDSSVL